MSDRRGPDFDELVGGDLAPAERERLLRVHDALIAAGPPPELPPALEQPSEGGAVVPLRRPSRRRLAVAAVLAAAIAIAAFGVGFFVGDRGNASAAEPERVIEMVGGGDARASLAILPKDEAGNWPMRMTVQGLPPLPRGQEYELWLTRGGELDSPCGTFVVVSDGRTVVALNAPYVLKNFDGWVVTRRGSQKHLLETV